MSELLQKTLQILGLLAIIAGVVMMAMKDMINAFVTALLDAPANANCANKNRTDVKDMALGSHCTCTQADKNGNCTHGVVVRNASSGLLVCANCPNAKIDDVSPLGYNIVLWSLLVIGVIMIRLSMKGRSENVYGNAHVHSYCSIFSAA